MRRRGFFGAALAGMLAPLAMPAEAADGRRAPAVGEGEATTPRRSSRAASPPGTECTREAPCTGPRGGRYWLDANGRRRSVRRPRTTTPAAAGTSAPAR